MTYMTIFFCAALASAVTGSFLRTVACTMALRAALKSFVVPIIVICGVRAVGRVSLWRSYITRLSRLYGCLSRPIHARCVCVAVIGDDSGNVGSVGNVSNVGNVGNVGIMCVVVIGGFVGVGA